jgi:hypothetical protein
MKKIKFQNVVILFAVFAFLFAACEKEDTPKAPEVEIAEDDALTTDLYEDIFAEVEEAMEIMEDDLYGGGLKSAPAVICKTITVERPDDSTFWPRTVTIDYGEGCIGPNGRTRMGKIIIVVNDRYVSENYYRTVTFENFYIDNYKIEGEKTVNNEGVNENGNIYFSVVLSGGKVISPEGKEISKEYNRIREWVAGSETPRFRWDDEYMITGSATGVNRNQVAYTRTIVEPLHVTRDCRWVKSGTIEIEAEERENALLDYGDGTCDRFATVTVGDKTWTIRLHR